MKPDYSKLMDQRLEEALTNAAAQTQSSFDNPEDFRRWLREGEARQLKQRRRKIHIVLAAAAVFLCAVILAGSTGLLSDILPANLTVLLQPGESIASPNPHDSSAVSTENGSIVIGGDGNGNVGTWTASFVRYEDIPEKYQQQIIWFENMPEGYELEEIEIVNNVNNVEVYTVGIYKGEEMEIRQTMGISDASCVAVLNQFESYNEILHRKKSDEATTYAFKEQNNLIIIVDRCGIDNERIEAMIASIRIGWSK